MSKLKRVLHLFETILYYKIVLKKIGYKSVIWSPLKLENAQNISIGNKVLIGYKTWLAASPLTGEEDCILEIHDGSSIGNFNHIYATKKIIIHNNVLTADKVYISDNLHGYKNISIPILKQDIIQNNEVIIGEGSWIGESACILGSNIGKHCVVGANSVVTKDIPDYCVVAGAPAKIIKRYSFDKSEWLRTDSTGNFI